MQKTRVLMIHPETPLTYWSFKFAMNFIGKKSSFAPLNLITLAALLPEDFEPSLCDLNIEKLQDKDILAADLIFLTGMIVHSRSFCEVAERCRSLGKTVVAGGPYVTSSSEKIHCVDHLIIGEAEDILPQFIKDWKEGKAAKKYESAVRPDITQLPAPRYDLLKMEAYSSMSVQYSRGCPFQCEFCDIIEVFGRKPRIKTTEQFLGELQTLYNSGYRGSLFIVDDNFIGNKVQVKKSLLPALVAWQKNRSFPFTLFTEASINLAHDEELMQLMAEAGFDMVFLGIETPAAESLVLTQKLQNTRSGSLLDDVSAIHRHGMEVTGGFILGFDNDPEDIFERQLEFIQKAGVPLAMVGLLTALPNTQLYRRLTRENRLLSESSGNNTHDFRLNFKTVMDKSRLLQGYKSLLADIYNPARYFERAKIMLKRMPPKKIARSIGMTELRACAFSLFRQTFSSYGKNYLAFLFHTLFTNARMLSEAVRLSIVGHHFFVLTRELLATDQYNAWLSTRASLLKTKAQQIRSILQHGEAADRLQELRRPIRKILGQARRKYNKLHQDFRESAAEKLREFEQLATEIIPETAG